MYHTNLNYEKVIVILRSLGFVAPEYQELDQFSPLFGCSCHEPTFWDV